MSTYTGMIALVVDDEDMLRDVLSDCLKDMGFTVLEADNGVAAFEIVKTKPVDLILSDVKMPKGSGVELLANLKTLQQPPAVTIMMTGFSDLTPESAKKLGAYDIIHKPFHSQDLFQIIKRSLNPRSEKN